VLDRPQRIEDYILGNLGYLKSLFAHFPYFTYFICHISYGIVVALNFHMTYFIWHMKYALPLRALRRSSPRNLRDPGRGNAEIAFSRAVGDATFANDLAAQNLAVDAQFLFANLRISDRDAFDRAVALPQTIRAVFHPPRVGQIAFHVDLSGQAFDALVEIPPAQLHLKLRD